MSQTQKVTDEAIVECKKMTARLSEIISSRELQQRQFDERMSEYQRKKGIHNMAQIEYNRHCSDGCQFGGVQTKGCHPMCTNWIYLNPEPIQPPAPVYPDLGAFACTICSQNVDVSALASHDVNIARKALEQQMSCVTNLNAKAEINKNTQPASTPTSKPTSKPTTSKPTTSKNTGGLTSTQWIIIGIVMFVIIMAIGGIIIWLFIFPPTSGGFADDFGVDIDNEDW